mgnify:CR=1 FL=1
MQEIATARSTTVSDLLKPIMKAFDSILERRLLPIRSITAQARAWGRSGALASAAFFSWHGSIAHANCSACSAGPDAALLTACPCRTARVQSNHAHSVAFILRTCAPELALRSEPIIYITEACTAMEMSDAAIGATASFRGAPVRTEAIVRLRTACLQVLTAAISWQGFR